MTKATDTIRIDYRNIVGKLLTASVCALWLESIVDRHYPLGWGYHDDEGQFGS